MFEPESHWGYHSQVRRPQITLDIRTPCHFLTETRSKSILRKPEKSSCLHPFVHFEFQKREFCSSERTIRAQMKQNWKPLHQQATSTTYENQCARGCSGAAPAPHPGLHSSCCTAGRTQCCYMHSAGFSLSILSLKQAYEACAKRSVVLNGGFMAEEPFFPVAGPWDFLSALHAIWKLGAPGWKRDYYPSFHVSSSGQKNLLPWRSSASTSRTNSNNRFQDH